MKNKKSFMILCFLTVFILSGLSLVLKCYAVPAAPDIFEIVQPDGSIFNGRMKGDEWNNWTETVDGYSIEKDRNGYWRYISHFDGKSPVLSSVYADETPPSGLAEHVRPSPGFMRSRSEGEESPGAPSQAPVGPFTGNILFILAEFTDQTGFYSEASFGTFINNNINDYFNKASYGDVTLNPANETSGTVNNGVVGWVNIGYPHPNTAGSINDNNRQLTRDAIIAADPFINFAVYDTDSDGYIDPNELAVVVIVAGYERAFSASFPSVWGHKWSLGWGAVSAPSVDGKLVADTHGGVGGYAQFGEKHFTHQATMGIMVHELGHLIFGLPDLYDTTIPQSEGLGAYGVMGAGSWGRISGEDSGETPVLPCAWSKYDRGWVNASTGFGTVSITAAGAVSATEANTVLRVTTALPNEYFMVENRQPLGYDRGLERWLGAGFGGLAIWHIDSNTIASKRSINQINGYQCYPGGPSCVSDHFGVAIEQADANWDLEKGNNRGNTTDLWYSGNQANFNSGSTPDSNLYDGSLSGAGVTNISASGTVMTADFGSGCFMTFNDVPSGHWARDFISALACAGVTAGCGGGNYCPDDDVTRAQMAVFIIVSMGQSPSGAAYNAYFDDIANDGYAPYINRMFELGITSGCGTRAYCPNNSVTRAQMAVFIIIAMGQNSSGAAYNAYFDDIANDGYAPYINRMFELGITAGCAVRTYCPNNPVNRAEMAVFLVIAFNL